MRIASRKLGYSATPQEVEMEAVRMLDADGFAPFLATTVPGLDRPSNERAPDVLQSRPIQSPLHISVSAAGCTSRRPQTQRARLYDLLRKQLLLVPGAERQRTYLHVRDTSSLYVGHSREVVNTIGEVLSDVVRDMNLVHAHGPFIDAALPENLALIEQLPDLISVSDRICPLVQLSTVDNGHSRWAVEALAYALSLISSSRPKQHPLILSVNDCDRRAFGHRVHPESIVIHRRTATHEPSAPSTESSLPSEWHLVASADLPMIPDGLPERTTDHLLPLPDGGPDAVRRLIEDQLLSHATSGARRQVLLMC